MQQEYLIHEGHPRLLLFFAGWACDAHPFKQYHPQGMDFMICYDYRTLRFDEELICGYQSYHIIGWSMGVWAAACILPKLIQAGVLSPGNHTSIAFNGTASPISHSPEEEGIPSELFEGTLQNLTPVSLQKFFRRICSNSTTYRALMEITPRRPFEEVKEELACIKQQASGEVRKSFVFDRYYYGADDKIYHFNPARTLIPHCAHYDEPLFRYLLQDQHT